jgi:V8-like Glu-specific endopeptidase
MPLRSHDDIPGNLMKRRLPWLLHLPPLFAVAVLGCSSSEPTPKGRVAQLGTGLIGGSETTAQGTGAVYIKIGADPSDLWDGCTGVVIASNKVITAAHCVLRPTGQLPGGAHQYDGSLKPAFKMGAGLLLSNSTEIGGSAYWVQPKITQVDVHPDVVKACKSTCVEPWSRSPYASDLAIVTLDTAFPSCFGRPATWGTASPGDKVVKTGYGCEGGPDLNAPRFKEGTDVLLDPSGVGMSDAYAQGFLVTGGSANSSCPGDSGGPLFKGNPVNGGIFVGITSHGAPTSHNWFARVDSSTTRLWLAGVLGASTIATTPPDRGKPMDALDPVTQAFRVSTVQVRTGARECTGVILSHNTVLTAAQCKADSSSGVYFYGADGGVKAFISVTRVFTPDGVTCDPTVTESIPASCVTGTGTATYADLAVLQLSDDVPGDYFPVTLPLPGPLGSGTGPDVGSGDSLWQVAATDDSLRWAPAFGTFSLGATMPAQFQLSSVFGYPSDSGGPIFQYAKGAKAQDGGAPPLVLLGIASTIGTCQEACGDSCDTHLDTFTDVGSSDNYGFLIKHGGSSTATPVDTFGASK